MIKVIHDINPYVENNTRYKADSVKVELEESSFRVTVYPVDTTGKVPSGLNPIVDKTEKDLASAIKFYNKMCEELSQGDIIRSI